MTRPRTASEKFLEQLPSGLLSRVDVIRAPLLDIRTKEVRVSTSGLRGLIFSSANGVVAASRLIAERSLPAFCVGRATTEAAAQAGWSAQMAGETADALVAELLKDQPDMPLLHLRGEHSRGQIADRLTQGGVRTGETVIYHQETMPFSDAARAAMAQDRLVIAPVFSPRTARQFADLWTGPAPLWLVAISESAAEPLETLKAEKLMVARRPNADEMGNAVKKLVKLAMRLESGKGAD